MSMNLTQDQELALTRVIETLWEYESGWGMDKETLKAARLLQKELGYTTEWDAARDRSLAPSEGSVAPHHANQSGEGGQVPPQSEPPPTLKLSGNMLEVPMDPDRLV